MENYIFDVEKSKSENLIGRMIKSSRLEKGYTQDQLRKLLENYNINVRIAAICKWENGDNLPSVYQLIALYHALEMHDLKDIFDNADDPLSYLNEAGKQKVREYIDDLLGNAKYDKRVPTSDLYTEVKLFELPVSAGNGSFLDGYYSDIVKFPTATVPERTDFCLKISGDSMEPRYSDGSYVFVEKCENIEPGEIGIFIYNGESYIKMFNASPQAELISLNPKYDPIVIEPDAQFALIGKVLN